MSKLDPSDTSTSSPPLAANRYWHKTRRLTLTLLLVWFVLTFGTIFFARELDRIQLFGWPLSFYLAAQGMMLIYLLIVALYTLIMARFERQFHADNEHAHGE